MLRLVKLHQNETVTENCLYAARMLEREGKYKEAEKYYLEGREWKHAINLHMQHGTLEDALRIAKSYGNGQEAINSLSYEWATHFSQDDQSFKQLKKLSNLKPI